MNERELLQPCVMNGATGLPSEFEIANSDGKDGWIVEASS